MQDWSKSLPSLSGNTDQAPKAPVQQTLGTPRRGHIQCLGRDGRCFSRAVTSATQQHCQHRLAPGKGAVCTPQLCTHTGSWGWLQQKAQKFRGEGIQRQYKCRCWRLHILSQTAPHRYKNKGSSSTELTFLKSCK